MFLLSETIEKSAKKLQEKHKTVPENCDLDMK